MARPCKPRFLRALNGTARPLRVRETSPSSAPLKAEDKPPAALRLTRQAKQIWKQLLLETVPSGLILQSDALEFGRYCELLHDRNSLRDLLRERGRTILLRNEAGAVYSEKPRPELGALHKTESELRLLGSLLGLTPSARQKVSVSAKDFADDLDEQLFG